MKIVSELEQADVEESSFSGMPWQGELALDVPVCAWCKPHPEGHELDVVTHGICPRHFEELKHEMEEMTGHAPADNEPQDSGQRPNSQLDTGWSTTLAQ